MQLAETLGITAEEVWPRVVDTDSVGFNFFTAGSRTAFAGGWAAYELGMEIRKQMVARAATIWECDEDEVTYGDDGIIRGPKDAEGKDRQLTFKELAGQLGRTGGTIEVGVNINKSSVGPAFAGHIVDVEVDRDTGKVTGPPLHGHPGRRHGDPPQLRRGPDPGRRRPGHRHGADRGVPLRRRRPHAELEPTSTTACRPRSTCR